MFLQSPIMQCKWIVRCKCRKSIHFDICHHKVHVLLTVNVLIGAAAPLEQFGFRPLLFSSDKYNGAIFLNEMISHTLRETIYHIGF